jgi:20S proteasome alpha/beta subunit
MDETSSTKVQILCDQIGAVYSGFEPDFRLLVQKSRKIVQK